MCICRSTDGKEKGEELPQEVSLTGQEACGANMPPLRSVAASHAKGAFARQSNFFKVTYWTAGRWGVLREVGRSDGTWVGGAGRGCQSCCSYVKSGGQGGEAATSGRPTLDEVT